MSWRRVAVFYLVFAALAAEYWFVERTRERHPETRPARPPFLGVRAEQLEEVRLIRGARSVIGRREDGRWILVEPADAPIPSDLIAAYTNALAGAEEIAHIGVVEAGAHDYGLDEGATRVELVSATGERVLVRIGGTNPTGTAVYAQRAGIPGVVLIGRNVRYYEDLIFQATSPARVPTADAPVGG